MIIIIRSTRNVDLFVANLFVVFGLLFKSFAEIKQQLGYPNFIIFFAIVLHD